MSALVKNLDPEKEFFPMVVRRSNILVDALRRMQRMTFKPEKTIEVEYFVATLHILVPVVQ